MLKACGSCYLRKTKCDGKRPCARCVRLDLECGERPPKRGRHRKASPIKKPVKAAELPPFTPDKVYDLSQWAKEPIPAGDLLHVLQFTEWNETRVLAAVTSESPTCCPPSLPKES
jgi:hypothetical protein